MHKMEQKKHKIAVYTYSDKCVCVNCRHQTFVFMTMIKTVVHGN